MLYICRLLSLLQNQSRKPTAACSRQRTRTRKAHQCTGLYSAAVVVCRSRVPGCTPLTSPVLVQCSPFPTLTVLLAHVCCGRNGVWDTCPSPTLTHGTCPRPGTARDTPGTEWDTSVPPRTRPRQCSLSGTRPGHPQSTGRRGLSWLGPKAVRGAPRRPNLAARSDFDVAARPSASPFANYIHN